MAAAILKLKIVQVNSLLNGEKEMKGPRTHHFHIKNDPRPERRCKTVARQTHHKSLGAFSGGRMLSVAFYSEKDAQTLSRPQKQIEGTRRLNRTFHS